MTSSPSFTGPDFEQVFAEYLHASEIGDKGFIERLTRENPQFAESLREFDEGQGLLRSAVDQLNPKEHLPRTATALQNLTVLNSSNCEAYDSGTRLGDFELVREIGAGGMSVVYEALQLRLGKRRVALKISRYVDALSAADADHNCRFRIEGVATAKLDHPNVVEVLDSGHDCGRRFIVMKLIHGNNLKSTPLGTCREEVRRLIQVADGVQHAHDHGILHRDLKPSNIIVDCDNNPIVTDFGLAKFLADDHEMTRTGASVGTPQYMSPEQASGQRSLTVASDVYALGAILFERICGRPLYDHDENPMILLQKVQLGARSNLHLLSSNCDRDLRTIVIKCTEFNANDRYANCRDLAKDLTLWLAGEAISANAVTPMRRGYRWIRQHPWRALASVAVVMLAILLVGLIVANVQANLRWRITEYAKNLENARMELSENRAGWKHRAYKALENAERFANSSADIREIASLKANCDIGFDIGNPIFSVPQTNTVALYFHPTRPWLLVARKHGENNAKACPILVVDTKSGKTLQVVQVHDADFNDQTTIRSMAISPLGDWLAVITTNCRLHVFEIVDRVSDGPKVIVTLPKQKYMHLVSVPGVEALILKGYLTEKNAWQISSINTANWAVQKSLRVEQVIHGIAVAGDMQRLILDTDARLKIIDPITLEETHESISDACPGPVAYHSGRVAHYKGPLGISLFDIPHMEKTRDLEPPLGGFPASYYNSAIAFSCNGELLATADERRRQVHVWSAVDGKFLQSITVKDSMYRAIHFAFSTDGLIAISSGRETVVSPIHHSALESVASSTNAIECMRYAKAQREILMLVRLKDDCAEVARFKLVASNSSRIVSSKLNGIPNYLEPNLVMYQEKGVLAVTIQPFLKPSSTKIQVFANTGEALAETPELSKLRNIAFDSTGRLLATANAGVVSLSSDFASIQRNWTRPQIEDSLVGSEHYPVLELIDDEHVFVGDEDGWLIKLLWSDRPVAISTYKLGSAPLWSSALSPNADLLAVGDGDGGIHIVEAGSALPLFHRTESHWARVTALAWTEDGYLVSAGWDQTLKFWAWDSQTRSLEEIMKLKIRGNIRQIIPLASAKLGIERHEFLVLRAGSHAIEKLTINLKPLAQHIK